MSQNFVVLKEQRSLKGSSFTLLLLDSFLFLQYFCCVSYNHLLSPDDSDGDDLFEQNGNTCFMPPLPFHASVLGLTDYTPRVRGGVPLKLCHCEDDGRT